MTSTEILGFAGVIALLLGLSMFGYNFEPRVFEAAGWRRLVLSEAAPYLLAFVALIAWWLWAR